MLSRINKLKIAPRLILSFAVIVLLMLVGNSLLVWQFLLVRQQSDRVSALARELIVVSRFQTDILSLDAKLDSLAKSEDIDGLKREAGRLRSVLFVYRLMCLGIRRSCLLWKQLRSHCHRSSTP